MRITTTQRWRAVSGLALLLILGCHSPTLTSSLEFSDATDATDAADASDGSDGADTTSEADAADGASITDGADALDVADGADQADAADGVDATITNASVDLIVDNNRNGVLDLDDPSEDAYENVWNKANGAVFLANIDDDQDTCTEGNKSDYELAECHDAADDEVNGLEDLLDMAPMRIRAWPGAPDDATATLVVEGTGANYVRIFLQEYQNNDLTYEALPQKHSISVEQIREGVNLRIEAKDIVRDADIWDGYITVRL
ncbi:MAG: hypothetical protein VX223_15045, partial [Myxococcota bacterium]|nr:hypothetical protein [Myxococcota bacterium]